MEDKEIIASKSSAEIDISTIKKIMEDSRNAVYDSGVQGIFWSVLIALTLIINYFIIITGTGLQYIGLTWIVLMSLGTIVSIIIARKEKKSIKAVTFAHKVLSVIWTSIGVSNAMMAFASVIAHAYKPIYIIPLDSIVLGIGFYITATIQQMKYLKLLSWIWWAGGSYFLVFPGIHCMLYFSLMLIASLLIPSIQNRSKGKLGLDPFIPSELNI